MGTARPFQNSHARSRRPCFQPWRHLRNGGKRAEDELRHHPTFWTSRLNPLALFLSLVFTLLVGLALAAAVLFDGELRPFCVYIMGLCLGLYGLGYNALAIWGLRSTPRKFQLMPSKVTSNVVLPMLIATALVASSYQGALNVIRRRAEASLPLILSSVPASLWWIPTCLGLNKASLVGDLSNAYFLSPSCLILHALLLGGLLGLVSLIHQFLSRNLSSTAGSSTEGSDWKDPFAAFSGGAVAGIFIAVTYELLRFTASQPWLRATIGPPLFLVDIVVGFCVLIAFLGRRITELEREWWGRLAGRLLRGALLWLILVGVIVYGPAALIGLGTLGPIAGSAALAVLAATWAAITIAGVRAGQSPKTGTGRGQSLLELLCSLAPPVFLIGLLTVLSFLTSAVLEVVARPGSPPSSVALIESSSAGITAASLGTTEQTRQHSEAASKQEGIAAAFNAASFGYLRNNLGRLYPRAYASQ